MTAEREHSRGGYIDGVRPQRDRLYDIGARTDGTAGDYRNIAPDPLTAQLTVDRREGKLDRDADIVAYPRRRGARTAAEAA